MLRYSLALWASVLLISTIATASAELSPDYLMDTDPEFRAPALVKRFNRDFVGLWRQALQKPQADLQRMTAETIAQAHVHGIPGLIALVPELEAILAASSSHPAARFAAARALIALESRSSATSLFDAGQSHGPELRQLVEPALATWDYVPARAVWIKRLDSSETYPGDLNLTMTALGVVRDKAALPSLISIVMDLVRPASVRLLAARAAGEIAENGLESDAQRLSDEVQVTQLINRLCAVRLLQRHSSTESRQLLIRLASDPEASIASAAMNRLNAIDPELVVPLADVAMTNADPQVREEAALAYLRQPTAARIEALAKLLGDSHPDLRKRVAEEFYQLSMKPEFDEVVRSSALRILNEDRWQGQSQAALLLGMLKHRPAGKRFIDLQDSPRPEVMINAAWALRKLADPSTAPAIVDRLRRQTAARKLQTIRGVDEQVAHLLEACGVLKLQEVEPLVRTYVRKDLKMLRSRGAAIWTLGQLHAGVPDSSLGNQLIERFLDDSPKEPEHPLIKQLCAVCLARMNAKDHAKAMRDSIFVETPPTPLGLATRWAVRELTGEELPEPVPASYPQGVWFLEPLELSPPVSK